jgi:DNA-binding protein YbaB
MGHEAPTDAQSVTARIEQQVREAQEHAARMHGWAQQVAQVTGEGSALRGAVRVSVNHSGVLQSLRLTDAALAGGAQGLTAAILSALEQAKQSVADETIGSAAALFGRDAEVTRLMLNDLSTRLGVSADLDAGRSSGRERRGPLGGVLG